MGDIYNGRLKKSIDKLLNTDDIRHDENLLELFSFYINSNPDFKYNGTYITDLILPFEVSQHQIKNRYSLFKLIASNTAKQTPIKLEANIVFDNLFRFEIKNSKISEIEYINLNLYRFDKINKECFIVKFIIGEIDNPKKTETFKLDISWKNGLIEKTKLKNETLKIWSNFVK